jgi:hypothetical protein
MNGTGDIRHKRLWDFEHIHVDDIATRTGSHIRGLDYITIDYDRAEARIRRDIGFNIAVRKESNGTNEAGTQA